MSILAFHALNKSGLYPFTQDLLRITLQQNHVGIGQCFKRSRRNPRWTSCHSVSSSDSCQRRLGGHSTDPTPAEFGPGFAHCLSSSFPSQLFSVRFLLCFVMLVFRTLWLCAFRRKHAAFRWRSVRVISSSGRCGRGRVIVVLDTGSLGNPNRHITFPFLQDFEWFLL